MGKQQTAVQMNLIAVALHVSIFIYVFVVFYLARTVDGWTHDWTLQSGREILLPLFVAAAVANGGLALFLPRILRGPKPQPSIPQMAREPLFFDFAALTPRVQTLTVVRMALAEAVVIFGFVLSFINFSTSWILPFAAAGLFLQVLVGPFGRLLRGP